MSSAREENRPTDERRSPFASRDFRLLFLGNLISSSGTWLQNVAQGVLVLRLTGRSALVGVVQAATFVPVMLLALHGGRLADRFDRRQLLIWTQVLAIASTGVLAILAASHRVGVTALVVVAVLLGIQYAVAIPAMQAMIPGLVPPEALGPAIGMMSITYNLSRAVGPLLATIAIGLGFGLAFGLNSLSFAALIGAALLIRAPSRATAETDHHDHGRSGRGAAGGSIREAVAHAWHDRRLRFLLIAVAAVSFATDPIYTLSPTFARDVFGRPASNAGMLVAAFGGGAIAASFLAGRSLRRAGASRARSGVAGIGVMLAGLVAFDAAPAFPAAIAALAVCGSGYLVAISTLTAGVQEAVAEALRGRVMAIWTLCFLGTRPLAALIDGALADLISPRWATLSMLIPAAAVGVAFLLMPPYARWPRPWAAPHPSR